VCPISSLGKSFGACNLQGGPQCYDRDNFTCCSSGSGSGKLCALGDTVCCGQAVVQTAVLAPTVVIESSVVQVSTVVPPVPVPVPTLFPGITCPEIVVTREVVVTQAVSTNDASVLGATILVVMAFVAV